MGASTRLMPWPQRSPLPTGAETEGLVRVVGDGQASTKSAPHRSGD